MRKIKELISNHKAISIGLMLVLVLVLVDGGIFFRNLMNKPAEIQQEQQEEQKFVEEKQQEEQQQQQQEQQQQQNTGGNTTPRPVCNQAAANSFTTQYNAAVAAENARHEARLAEIQNGPELYPGYKQIATAQENALHQQNMNNLYNQYQANLRSVNC